jgi:hypothetical protein
MTILEDAVDKLSLALNQQAATDQLEALRKQIRVVVDNTKNPKHEDTIDVEGDIAEKMKESHADFLRDIDAMPNDGEGQRLCWRSSSTPIEASSFIEMTSPITEKNTCVHYSFSVKEMDILFSVKLVTNLGSMHEEVQTLIEPIRVSEADDSLEVPECGMLTFIWDNRYSWVTAKEVSYNVQVVKQDSDEQQQIRSDQAITYMGKQIESVHHAKTKMKSLETTLENDMGKFESLRLRHDEMRMRSRAQAKDLFEKGRLITERKQKMATLELMVDLWHEQIKDLRCRSFDSRVYHNIVSFGTFLDFASWATVCKDWEEYISSVPGSKSVGRARESAPVHFSEQSQGHLPDQEARSRGGSLDGERASERAQPMALGLITLPDEKDEQSIGSRLSGIFDWKHSTSAFGPGVPVAAGDADLVPACAQNTPEPPSPTVSNSSLSSLSSDVSESLSIISNSDSTDEEIVAVTTAAEAMTAPP